MGYRVLSPRPDQTQPKGWGAVNLVIADEVAARRRQTALLNLPKGNQKTTSFLPEERGWIDHIVEKGYVDTFRHFHPGETQQYTWWSMPTGVREHKVG